LGRLGFANEAIDGFRLLVQQSDSNPVRRRLTNVETEEAAIDEHCRRFIDGSNKSFIDKYSRFVVIIFVVTVYFVITVFFWIVFWIVVVFTFDVSIVVVSNVIGLIVIVVNGWE
jgi:hypothetical protein